MKRSLLMILALLVGMLTLAACGDEGDDTEATTEITDASETSTDDATDAGAPVVALGEFYVEVDQDLSAGEVTLTVTNEGSAPHELAILDTETMAADLETNDDGTAVEDGLVAETGSIEAGESTELTVTLESGHYVFLCNVPGHYAAGQYTDITVA